MATYTTTRRIDRAPGRSTGAIAARVVIVALTLATAAIHASLGGLLFTANAIGYTTLAVAMIVPGPIGGVRWLVRLALLGFTAATIVGWVLFGARFSLAYVDKAIELVLVATVTFELWHVDGGVRGVTRQARGLVRGLVGLVSARAPK
jgi:hypothetical protein